MCGESPSFVRIQGRRRYLWRAVDQDGDVIDVLVHSRRDRRAATRFFRKLLKVQGRTPRRLVTDKLRSYAAAHRTVMPSIVHSTPQYENNRAEVSHQPTRQREGQMRRFKSVGHAGRSYRCTVPCRICFGSVDTCCWRLITACFEHWRSSNGMR